MDFSKAFYALMADEGLWHLEHDPRDPGGETWSGISRKNHPRWDGWSLIDQAKADGVSVTRHRNFERIKALTEKFYEDTFWLPLDCDNLPDGLAYELFEQAVNLGISRTTYYLQLTLNCLNKPLQNGAKEFGSDLVVDKAYGPATRNRLLAIVEKGRAQAVQNGINGLQAAWYINLGTKNISRRVFTNGWLSKRGRGSI